ncbi:MAG: TonB-dependent receptor plug domain-containing protein, partial [Ferruginibacter sp.]
MKLFIMALCLCACSFMGNAQKNPTLSDTAYLQPVEVNAVRASDKTPVAKTNLSKKIIEKNNIGQDLPFILNQTPSVVVNSDAGTGIGYTGIRVRGTDASRINVTLNGIPYNDAESQGTYFVDLPDISSSAGSIQVQRGVGTSTNGAGAFGGSINISTNDIIPTRSLEVNNSIGSYNFYKNTLKFNSGIMGKHFIFDGRLSSIRSNGYIDRAKSNLKSFYASTAYVDSKNSLRMNVFSGKEKTYQAWYGIDSATLSNNRRFNSAGTEKSGEPYRNETDNYTQTHYQLFYNHKFNTFWKASVATFLTKGKGYYEQYKTDKKLSSYGLPDFNDGNTIIKTTDLIRRLWLDNDFYGSILSAQYQKNNTGVIIGGGWNKYDGKHYGEIIWAQQQAAIPKNYRWYNLTATKQEYSAFTKWTEQFCSNLQSFIDFQVRKVNYSINGFRDNPELRINKNYFFFNPKAGLTYSKNKNRGFISYARAAKEPNRDDFEAGVDQQPKAEILNDFEAGLEHTNIKSSLGINLYYMLYKDQLVLTGKINDVGSYTRTNIAKSYRAGIELQGAAEFLDWLSASGNISFSRNKIKNFTEYIDDYDNGGQQTKFYSKPDIAFSP